MSGRCDRDSLRIERILVTYQRLKKRLEFTGTSRDSFVDDVSEEGLLVYHAIMVMVLQIVEDAGMLSDYVKGAISNQPWRNIRGFRNLLAHTYYQVDKEMAWEVVDRDIPALCRALEQLRDHGEQRSWLPLFVHLELCR